MTSAKLLCKCFSCAPGGHHHVGRVVLVPGGNHYAGSGEATSTTPESGCQSPLWHGDQGMNLTVHRQVRIEDRTRRKQQRIRWSIASGVSSPCTDSQPSRIISGSKEKRFPGSNDQGQSGAELRPASRNASRTSRRGSACGPTPFVCTPDTGASRSEGRCCLRIPIGNAFRAGR